MTSKRKWRILHFFCGSGGSGLGSKMAGFEGTGIDYDPRACEDYRRNVGEPAHCLDLFSLTIEELLAVYPECPDVLMSSSPCTGLSGCLSKTLSLTQKYQDFNSLAERGIALAVETWKHSPTSKRKQPGLIIFENVPLIKSRGKAMLERIVAMLHAEGYAVDMRSHDCGEIADGLAQKRPRFLLVARHMSTVPDFLRRPEKHRPLAIRDVLCELERPSPRTKGMHRLNDLSDLNRLRLGCIPAGGDWRNLPAEVLLVHCESHELEAFTGIRWGENPGRHAGKLGVMDWNLPSKTIIGNARICTTWAAVADPRVGWTTAGAYKDRPSAYGVADAEQPSATIRGVQILQNSKSAVPDPRVAVALPENDKRQNGGFGVLAADRPSGTVVAEGTTRNTRASAADPRLSCSARAGAYGMLDGGEPAPVIVGHHKHDNSPASACDPRLGHVPYKDSYGVQDASEPASVVRGEMSIRQAPSAVTDARLASKGKARVSKAKPHGRPALTVQYDERGWPVPTHELVILEDGRYVLYGPPLDFASKRPRSDVVIRAPDGTEHRALTTRELARIQGFPNWFEFCGPASCGKALADSTPRTGQRKRIGNAVPPPTAYAICMEAKATLIASDEGGFRLASGGIWVQPDERTMAA